MSDTVSLPARDGDRPLHVCHLIKGLGRGGAERLLPQMVRAAGEGLSFSAGYFLPHKDALVAELEAAGCPVTCFAARSAPGMLLRVPSVAGWLRRQGADLVHAHLPLAGVVGRLAAARAGVPAIYTEHNLQERYHPLTRFANLRTWKRQRAVIAVSAEVADSIAARVPRTRGRPPVPVHAVRNGIEVLPVDAAGGLAVRQRLGIPPRAPVVGTVAVFRSQKRLDLWLAAAARIAGAHPDARFLLVGDGPLRAEVESWAEERGLAGKVLLPGLQEEVRPFLAALDVYLMTSEFEGLPLALLEAMAACRAVAVTAVGGIPEVVTDGVDGIVRPFADSDRLADDVTALLSEPERRHALGAAARRRVEAEFGIARMVREIEAIYCQVVGRQVVGRQVVA